MPAGDDLDAGVALDGPLEVAQLAVDLDGERVLGQALADRLGDAAAGDGALEVEPAAVGQSDPHRARALRDLVSHRHLRSQGPRKLENIGPLSRSGRRRHGGPPRRPSPALAAGIGALA